MPVGFATIGSVTPEARAAVDDLATMVQEATGDACTIDLMEATHRAVSSPFPVNENILLVYFCHGGQLINPQMERELSAEFTARHGNWQVLFAPMVLPNWWANGQAV